MQDINRAQNETNILMRRQAGDANKMSALLSVESHPAADPRLATPAAVRAMSMPATAIPATVI